VTTQTDQRAIQEIIEREKRRCRATGARDWATLDDILADDFTYTHTNGLTEDKVEYLRGLHTRTLAIERREIDVRLLGEVAVATGTGEFTLTVTPESADSPPKLQVMMQSTLEVWGNPGRGWRLIAFQGTRQV
jgi:Domain of unknown function (DUF4440)